MNNTRASWLAAYKLEIEGRRNLIRSQTNSIFVSREEFCSLLISKLLMDRIYLYEERLIGLEDRILGNRYFIPIENLQNNFELNDPFEFRPQFSQ